MIVQNSRKLANRIQNELINGGNCNWIISSTIENLDIDSLVISQFSTTVVNDFSLFQVGQIKSHTNFFSLERKVNALKQKTDGLTLDELANVLLYVIAKLIETECFPMTLSQIDFFNRDWFFHKFIGNLVLSLNWLIFKN